MTLAPEPSIRDQPAKAGRPAVLQVLPALASGGTERGAVDVAAALARAGGTAIVASEGGRLERELARAGAVHVKLPLASKNPLVMRRNAAALERLIRAHGVEIVHARSRAPAWSARAAANRCGVHFVTTFHGVYSAGNPLKRAYNAVMTKGERVIAPSEFVAGHIRETYGVEAERLRVILRGVNLEIFSSDAVTASRVIKLATSWRVPDGVKLIMLPARLTRWKGHGLLIEALTRLGDLEFCCVLLGDEMGRADYKRELEAMIAKRNLRSRAFVLGHCADMAAAYMNADVVVSASTEPEAFGRTISEAQAMGRPVVASDHGGAREQVLPGVTAFLFEPGNPDALAAALREALTLAPEARAHLSAQAEMHVRGKFSRDKMCAKTLALYDEVLRAR
jgi:glycosyltransferase involved in cell wall biosynthesis